MRVYFFLFFLFIPLASFSQFLDNEYRVMFYNVENLFDTIDDPHKNDLEFTPEGSKKWDALKYHHKLNEIYKVIIAIGEWNPPLVVGLAEVEKLEILDDLINLTPLHKFQYQAILEESDDQRGIDVGLIYRSDHIKYLSHKNIKVRENSGRGILLFTGTIREDTVHFLVNHWPSRISGKEHSEPFRLEYSKEMINIIDSICHTTTNMKLVLMGDFNDTPTDSSITQILHHKFLNNQGQPEKIVLKYDKDENPGTTVYTNVFTNWYLFDQILISDGLISEKGLRVFKSSWLINYEGRPDRTYLGDYYNGGLSDHLPVYIDFSVQKKQEEGN